MMLLDKPQIDHERVVQLSQFTSCESAIKSKEIERLEIERQTSEWLKKSKKNKIETISIRNSMPEIDTSNKKVKITIHEPRKSRERYMRIPVAGKSGELFIIQRGKRLQVIIKNINYGYFFDIHIAKMKRDETLKKLGLNQYGWSKEEIKLHNDQSKKSPN